ncbi:membrane-spanning 4-domains subfamily A member 6C-like [Osmerus mordax]|uniref:membrane-spanning 4-domains subfamily A member 6C-like n=1 Tax=Osmerus mordax TaxID=8014 RepID=UPI00351088CE
MSVTMTKGEGVTVFTLASNPKSDWPMVFQIFGTLCCSPICALSQRLRKLQGSSLSALGAIQILVGILNLGLGPILLNATDGPLLFKGVPYWLGGVFIAVGLMCVLAEKFPSPCLVGINVMINLGGAALAITGIVLYAIDLGSGKLNWMCYFGNDDWYSTARPSTETKDQYLERCLDAKHIAVVLTNSLEIVMIVLAVLQLCVTISSAVLGMKALHKNRKEQHKSQTEDPEKYSPLLEDVTA